MSDSPPADPPSMVAMREVVRWLLWREFTRDLDARHEVQDLFVEFTAEAANKYLNVAGLPPEQQRRHRSIADELRRLREALLTLQLSAAGVLGFGLTDMAESIL